MIEVKLTFANYTEAAVAMAKLAEGGRLIAALSEQDNATDTGEAEATGEQSTDTVATTTTRRRRTKAEIAADEAAKKAADATGEPAKPTNNAEAVDQSAVAAVDPFADAAAAATPVGFQARYDAWLKDNAGKTPTDFLRFNLQRVVEVSGMDGTRAFMVNFGHPRITEVPADKFDALLTAIDAHVAGVDKLAA